LFPILILRKFGSVFLAIAMVVLPSTLFAQKYFSGRNEWGFAVGMSNYYGDFSKGLNTKHFKPSGALYQKLNFSSYFGLRNQISYLQIQGTSEDIKGLQYQNINFQSEVIEAASMMEFNFHPFGTNINDGIATPYFLLGLGGFWFDPYRLDKNEVNVRDLRTEQQAKRYSQIQPCIPIGFGVKTMASNRQHAGGWIVGMEVIFRKTFTDYLDDTYKSYGDYKTIKEQQGAGAADWAQSQVLTGGNIVPKGTMRGDTHLKDWYYFAGLTFSYRFTPQVCR
jgi:hypothetical protein